MRILVARWFFICLVIVVLAVSFGSSVLAIDANNAIILVRSWRGHIDEELITEWIMRLKLSFSLLIVGAGLTIGWWLHNQLTMLFGLNLNLGIYEELKEEEVSYPSFPWQPNSEELGIVVGLQHNKRNTRLVHDPSFLGLGSKALFQNVIISGTIGTGKTVSAMYPFLKQLIFHRAHDSNHKVGMLILDVKGDFHKQVCEYVEQSGREADLITIDLSGAFTYNPLHKPDMEAIDLAQRSRTVLELFAGEGKKDAFWDEKAAQMMTECIRLMRCLNGYVTLAHIHRLVSEKEYLEEAQSLLELKRKIICARAFLLADEVDIKELNRLLVKEVGLTHNGDLSRKLRMFYTIYLKDLETFLRAFEKMTGLEPLGISLDDPGLWIRNPTTANFELSHEANELILNYALTMSSISDFDYRAIKSYFAGEFASDAQVTIATVQAVVTQMTAFFASSERIQRAFCPEESSLNFPGFDRVIDEGKIVVLAMNIAEYPRVARTIAAYLKLDFQAAILQRTAKSRQGQSQRPMSFICDEYQEYVTSNDGNFYGISRQARCCSIVATQSYTSLLKALQGNRPEFETLVQNLVNKIFFRTDDRTTIELAQFLMGKEEKTKVSKNLSESANDASLSGFFGSIISPKSTISESVTYSSQLQPIYDEKDFTQMLSIYKAIGYLASDIGMQEPTVIHMLPHFLNPIKDAHLSK